MKRQLGMEATSAIISDIERKHKCVIERDIPLVEEIKEPSGTPTIDQPCHPMSYVTDKEIELASGQRIKIVVGNLAQQKVYRCGIMISTLCCCCCLIYWVIVSMHSTLIQIETLTFKRLILNYFKKLSTC